MFEKGVEQLHDRTYRSVQECSGKGGAILGNKCKETVKRTVYFELPDEGKTDGEDQVGELLKTMCGTRDARAKSEGFHSEVLEGAGAKTGLFSPCLLSQEQTKLKAWVHGDDMEGKRGDTRALESKLKERMLIKRRAGLGWAKHTTRKSLHPTDRLICGWEW